MTEICTNCDAELNRDVFYDGRRRVCRMCYEELQYHVPSDPIAGVRSMISAFILGCVVWSVVFGSLFFFLSG